MAAARPSTGLPWAAVLVAALLGLLLAPRAIAAPVPGDAAARLPGFLPKAIMEDPPEEEGIPPEDIVRGIVCMVTGLVLCFAGYRIFKVLMFFSGFFAGYWICYSIMTAVDVEEEWIILVTGCAAGLIVGLFVLYLTQVGIFILGCMAGYFLALWALSFFDPTSPVVVEELYKWLFICGMGSTAGGAQALVAGLISLCWQKPLIIVSSAFMGAFLLFYGIDMFAQTGFADNIEALFDGEGFEDLDTDELLMLIFAPLTSLLGILAQIRLSRGKDHRQKDKDPIYIQIN